MGQNVSTAHCSQSHFALRETSPPRSTPEMLQPHSRYLGGSEPCPASLQPLTTKMRKSFGRKLRSHVRPNTTDGRRNALSTFFKHPPQRRQTWNPSDRSGGCLCAVGEVDRRVEDARHALEGTRLIADVHVVQVDTPSICWPRSFTVANGASFSPDGESLVFGTQGGRLLQRVALSGGAPQHVATLPVPTPGGVHWGDDGNVVVFSQAGGSGLYRVPA